MKKINIVVMGKTYEALADACEHAADMLRAHVPSERVTWDDRSHVDFTVKESSDEEFCEETGEEPEGSELCQS